MQSTIVTVAEFLPNEKATLYFYKSLLESEGIYCIVVGDLNFPTVGNILLQVAAADVPVAQEILGKEAKEQGEQ